MFSSLQVFGIDSELFSMKLICKFGYKLVILEILKDLSTLMIWMSKEVLLVLLLIHSLMFISMVFQFKVITQFLVFLIPVLIREEFGTNVQQKPPKLIERNSVNPFTVFIKLVLINVSNFIIIVNNVVTKLFLNLKKFLTLLVGEDVSKNLKKLLRESQKLRLLKLK